MALKDEVKGGAICRFVVGFIAIVMAIVMFIFDVSKAFDGLIIVLCQQGSGVTEILVGKRIKPGVLYTALGFCIAIGMCIFIIVADPYIHFAWPPAYAGVAIAIRGINLTVSKASQS